MPDIRQLAPDDFPKLLREIPDPPKKLFVRGTVPSDGPFLAVVGSRAHTGYGKEVVEYLIAGLANTPVVIVSGLALGIDALAHKAALRHGLTTIAVPGSGLGEEVLYPRSNVSLARSILDAGGALLSEFDEDQGAARWTFPQRNRIMAGMSHATLLIEAGERSGTLITARLASDYNRELLVVPGSIFSPQCSGTHQFLKLGATPITEPSDIMRVLNISPRERAPEPTLGADEASVVKLLSTPVSRDELIRALQMPASEAQVLIMNMELRGLLRESNGVLTLASPALIS